MRKDAWRCNNDEHVNKSTDIECEICGEKRPFVKLLKYDLTDEFGKVKIIWDLVNAENATLIKKKKEINLDSLNGELEIDRIKNKEEITLSVSNNIATYTETLQILLSKPEISFFKSDKDKILENTAFNLFWEVKNAKSVSISNIGKVDPKGNIEKLIAKTPYKIIAENDLGKEDLSLNVIVLPLPKIKEFRSKQQKIEFGKETHLAWDIDNAEKVELHYAGNLEVVGNRGDKTISPTEHTNYKLIITALDGVTKEEKEITVQVFKRVEIKRFVSDLEFVIESLPIKLSWNIENASTIIIEDNFGTQTEVTNDNNLEISAKRNTRFFKIIASDPLGNHIEKRIDITVDERPRININLPKIELPHLDLSFGQKVLENTSFELAFKEAKKEQKPFNPFRKLVNFLYDK